MGGTFSFIQVTYLIRTLESKMTGWAERVSPMKERGINVKCWRGPLQRCPLRIPRTRWNTYVRIHLREAGYDDRRWMELTQDCVI